MQEITDGLNSNRVTLHMHAEIHAQGKAQVQAKRHKQTVGTNQF